MIQYDPQQCKPNVKHVVTVFVSKKGGADLQFKMVRQDIQSEYIFGYQYCWKFKGRRCTPFFFHPTNLNGTENVGVTLTPTILFLTS